MHPAADEFEEALARAAGYLRGAQQVAALTGAGISAESGLATFRGAGGLWEGQPVEDVATPYAFERDPALVWRFYNARRAGLQSARPNPGHIALARLEERLGDGRFALITQNVDGLHRAAGSRCVLEVHGSLSRVRCTGCGQGADRPGEPLDGLPACPECGALLRPDVVWFGETLDDAILRQAFRAAETARTVLVVGTSNLVYPAASLPHEARARGARVVEINPEETPLSPCAHESIRGPATVEVPKWWDRFRRELDPG